MSNLRTILVGQRKNLLKLLFGHISAFDLWLCIIYNSCGFSHVHVICGNTKVHSRKVAYIRKSNLLKEVKVYR